MHAQEPITKAGVKSPPATCLLPLSNSSTGEGKLFIVSLFGIYLKVRLEYPRDLLYSVSLVYNDCLLFVSRFFGGVLCWSTEGISAFVHHRTQPGRRACLVSRIRHWQEFPTSGHGDALHVSPSFFVTQLVDTSPRYGVEWKVWYLGCWIKMYSKYPKNDTTRAEDKDLFQCLRGSCKWIWREKLQGFGKKAMSGCFPSI